MSKNEEKNEKKIEPPRTKSLARPVSAVTRPCHTLQSQNPQFSRMLTWPVSAVTRPCATPRPPFTKKISSPSFIHQHKLFSSSTSLSKPP